MIENPLAMAFAGILVGFPGLPTPKPPPKDLPDVTEMDLEVPSQAKKRRRRRQTV